MRFCGFQYNADPISSGVNANLTIRTSSQTSVQSGPRNQTFHAATTKPLHGAFCVAVAESMPCSSRAVPDGSVEVSDASAGVGEAHVPDTDGLGDVFAVIDAVLARSGAAIEEAKKPGRAKNAPKKEPFAYDLDGDEDERLQEWRAVLARAQDLPPVLQAIVALDAWNEISVLQHAPWLGRRLAASVLR